MTLDAHVHLWRLARGDNVALNPSMKAIYCDREPADLKPLLDVAGVQRVVVVQAAETLAETLFTTGLARKFPWIAGIIAWLDPASPAIEEEVAALDWIGIVKGVRPVRGDNASIAWMLERQPKGVGERSPSTSLRSIFSCRIGVRYHLRRDFHGNCPGSAL